MSRTRYPYQGRVVTARGLLDQIGANAIGPRSSNSIYTVEAGGKVWTISRFRWETPRLLWGWQAKAPGEVTIKGDSLDDIVFMLGFREVDSAD